MSTDLDLELGSDLVDAAENERMNRLRSAGIRPAAKREAWPDFEPVAIPRSSFLISWLRRLWS